jgi:hypothetical protein
MYAVLVGSVSGIAGRALLESMHLLERYLDPGQPFGHKVSGLLAICTLFFDSSVSSPFHTESTNH